MDFILLSSLLSITWWLNFKSVCPSVSVSFFLFFIFKLGVECANQCRQKCQQPTCQLFWNRNKPVQESSHLNTNTFNRTGKKSKMKPIKAALRTSQIFGSMSSSGCVSVMIHLLYVFSNWLLANLSDIVTGSSLMCKRLGELTKEGPFTSVLFLSLSPSSHSFQQYVLVFLLRLENSNNNSQIIIYNFFPSVLHLKWFTQNFLQW